MLALETERLFLYPVKSCAGVERSALNLSEGRGVDGDRAFAFAIDPLPGASEDAVVDDGAFRRKSNFLHGMRWPEVVRIRPEIVAEAASSENAQNGFGAARIAAEFARALAPGAPAARLVAANSGASFADRNPAYVSIINLDTLEAFAAAVGDPEIADPLRWRCNIFIRAGLGAEYAWARENMELKIGGAPLRVEKLLGRCAMIHSEPKLGRVDHPELMQELRAFEQRHGFEHPEERAPVMGVLALPLETAVIAK